MNPYEFKMLNHVYKEITKPRPRITLEQFENHDCQAQDGCSTCIRFNEEMCACENPEQECNETERTSHAYTYLK